MRVPRMQRRRRSGAWNCFGPGVEAIEDRILLNAPHGTGHGTAAALANAAAHTPPIILKAVEVIDAGQVAAFQITFSKPVVAAPLDDLSHYQVENLVPNSPHVTLASAIYNPEQNSLTLTPTTPQTPGSFILTAPGDSLRPSTAFITDAQGRPLLTPTRDFIVMFRSNGSDPLNGVDTRYAVLNSLDGFDRFLGPPVKPPNQTAFNIFSTTKLGVAGAAYLLTL